MHRVVGLQSWLLAATARILLLSLGVATLGPVLHGVHDDGCEIAIVVHDEDQHHIQAAPATDRGMPGDAHCVACHFARASRGAAAWEPSGLTTFATGIVLSHSDGHLIAVPALAPLPARAPPLA